MNQADKAFWYLVHEDDREPLAQYIEEGGDLSNLDGKQRLVLARLVRGQKPRGPGRPADPKKPERDWRICLEIACLLAYGLPAYTDTKDKPFEASDACDVVAQNFALSPSRVRTIWSKRDKVDPVLKALETAYRDRPDTFLPLPDGSPYKKQVEWLKNAWKKPPAD